MAIEGPSPEASKAIANEEVIDVAEYYSSEDFSACRRVEYIQLKHSTLRTTKAWSRHELKSTIERFAEIFRARCEEYGLDTAGAKFQFRIVSNRVFGPSVVGGTGATAQLNAAAAKALKLSPAQRKVFVGLLSFNGAENDYVGQRMSLRRDMNGYLAADDADAPIRLKDLVTQKATSDSAARNVIRRADVLMALEATEDRLYPANNLIEKVISNSREQEIEFARAICTSRHPIVIHAAGGVGKSILATRLSSRLPQGSISIVYDCFGNGSYRQAGRPRHNVQQGLVQIANELASLGLCDVLIPSNKVTDDQYFRAFEARLTQSSELIELRNSEALICLVVDAADNAETAAQELGEEPSFVRNLLREPLPKNVRLVVLSRTERLGLLNLPPETLDLKLNGFNEKESREHLRSVFPEATDAEAEEFHRLTSANPRVQAAALAGEGSLAAVLASLGVTPRSVDDNIASLLERAVKKLLDSSSKIERHQIETIAMAIATLRPFVPLEILATTANVDIALVESFAADLGRPLLISGGALQFRDEPTETWFRKQYRPAGAQLRAFTSSIESLAEDHPYAASTLPQLLLESGETKRLIQLALSGEALPKDPSERRTIEVQRLLFALKAALRSGMHLEASKLALKAGQEVSGVERQFELLANNLDLVGVLWQPHRIRELAGNHSLSSNWLGARHVYEAELFSNLGDADGEARSQVRMAEDWLTSWSSQSEEKRRGDEISDAMITYMADTAWRLDGAQSAILAIARWNPREVRYRVARRLARQALDAGGESDLQGLALASSQQLEVLLGIAFELNQDGLNLDGQILKQLIVDLKGGELEPFENAYWHSGERIEPAIVAVVEMAIRTGVDRTRSLSKILAPVLTGVEPYHFGFADRDRRGVLLRAFAIRCHLNEEVPRLENLLSESMRERLKKEPHRDERTIREFREAGGSLLPWHVLFVQNLVKPITFSELHSLVLNMREKAEKSRRSSAGSDSFLSDEIGMIWLSLLASLPNRSEEDITRFMQWANDNGGCRFIPTWIKMAHIAVRSTSMHADAYTFAQKARGIIETSEDLDASSRAHSYIEISRSLLLLDKNEAQVYFDEAIRVASNLGDEASQRWGAILDLADGAAGCAENAAQLAYRVSRCAEFVQQYESKHFDWESTIRAINGLSPTSGVAIVSRWHDRRFGSMDYTMPTLVNDLIARNLLKASWAGAFFWFPARWDYDGLLKKMLETALPQDRGPMFLRALRPLLLEEQGLHFWQNIRKVATDYNLSTEQVDERIALEEGKETVSSDDSRRNRYSHFSAAEDGQSTALVWTSLGLDQKLYTAADLTEAHRLWRAESTSQRHLSTERFLDLVLERASPERAVDLVHAVANSSNFDSWDLTKFFQKIPSSWRNRLSVAQTLQETARAMAKRFCSNLSKARFGEPNMFTVLSDVSGLSHRDIANEALSALADLPILDDPHRLFSLASLLVQNLTAEQSADGLSFGLSLLEEQLGSETGDGDWKSSLEPDEDVEEAMAGFLFAKLASPVTRIRWEAAHVIVERSASPAAGGLIKRLVLRDQQHRSAPYVDPNLTFYELHARQWLLIALARLGKEFPGLLIEQLDYLVEIALSEEHVLIRHFAREAALHAATGSGLSDETRQALLRVNVTAFVPKVSPSYKRNQDRLAQRDYTNDRFIFGYDIDRYWFEPLDRAFDLPIGTAMEKGQEMVGQPWAAPMRSKWKWTDDTRAQRGIFRDRETWASHSSYPSTDTLNFYLSYHALMKAAGELLKTNPPHRGEEDKEDDFVEWLQGHLLTRTDGFWLSDCRDPEPPGLGWLDEESDDRAWRSGVSGFDFARCLSTRTDRTTLSGSWTTVRGRRVEHVTVTSRLVSPDKAAALQRALQSATDPYKVNFPDEEDENEESIAEAKNYGFQVLSLLHHSTRHRNLDDLDAWAGSVESEEFNPARVIDQSLQTPLFSDGRRWVFQESSDHTPIAWSKVWGSKESEQGRDSYRDRGVTFEVFNTFLAHLLSAAPYKMIVRILIDRKISRQPYDNEKEDYTYVPPYFIHYVFDEDSTLLRV